jgi:hypothetical protein
MRQLLGFLLAFVIAVALGCGGGESSYQNREAPPDGASDPADAMGEMGPPGGAEQAAPSGGTPEGGPSNE